MGLNFMDINPIPHLTSPLKGEEQDKLALLDADRYDAVLHLRTIWGKRALLRKYCLDRQKNAPEPKGEVRGIKSLNRG
jgi:hypothetical protein